MAKDPADRPSAAELAPRLRELAAGSLDVADVAVDAVAANDGSSTMHLSLETGTAVLVDDTGDIRAHCYSGNPVKPKEVGHLPPRCLVMPGMVYARLGDPTSTPTATPLPTATVAPPPQPFQPFCSVDKKAVIVGESVTFSAEHVPGTVVVEYQISHGDGTVGGNPSTTSYDEPGTYLASARWEIDGKEDFVTCGTVDVVSGFAIEYRCSISETMIMAGGTTVFTGTTLPAVDGVSWRFDHGDGYSEVANPSTSLYPHAGNYTVTAFATRDGSTTEVHCGTVQVVE